MFYLACSLILVVLVSTETAVYIQNNSEYSLKFNSFTQSGTGGILPRNRWNHVPTTRIINPGERVKVIWFSRSAGITNGKTFLFSETLSLPWDVNKNITLQQHLTGTLVHSRMKHKVSGIFQTEWTSDRSIKKIEMKNERFYIIYRSYLTAGDDDIEYVFFKAADFSIKQKEENILRLFAYNLYMRYPRQFFLDGQLVRAKLFPLEIKRAFDGEKLDVFVFSEAFDQESKKLLINGLSQIGYKYFTPNVGRRGTIKQDGGVFIMSKWPILFNSSIVFKECSGTDCLAEKGVAYAKIKKNHKIYHIFGTHTQAWSNHHDIRVKQFREMIEFKNSLNLPKDEPVIYAGDMNVDMVRFPQQEIECRQILRADSTKTIGPIKYTFDPIINQLAKAEDDHNIRLLPREILDYVYFSKDHPQPQKSNSFVKYYLMRTKHPWKATVVSVDNWESSDHFPVYSKLDFNS